MFVYIYIYMHIYKIVPFNGHYDANTLPSPIVLPLSFISCSKKPSSCIESPMIIVLNAAFG